jgi:hypothetical protein
VTTGSASRTLVIACAVAGILHGCNTVGPQAIRGGRMAYNEAIAETNAQQMLMVPIHNRYEEGNHLLAVASVTANVRVSSSAGIQAGFGSSDNYDGNLVPFSGGVVYEENPTISYRPVTGEAYLKQLSSPIPLSLFSQISQVLPEPEFAYAMMLASINDIYNPAFLYGDQQDDPRFDRLVEIMTTLTREKRLHWVSEAGDSDRLSLLIQRPGGDDVVVELLELLQVPTEEANRDHVVVPVSLALDGMNEDSIGITTRSLWELVEILSAAVQVPTADEKSGRATSFPPPGRGGRDLQISFTEDRPDDAYIAVEYRDGWFSIDSRDTATKRYFKLLGSLWSAAMSESLDDAVGAPVLTVPVSR